MGELNERNYYQFQNLQTAIPFIAQMIKEGKKLKGMFRSLRKEARWNNVGDYPLMSFLYAITKEQGYSFSPQEIVRVLRETNEFKNIQQNSELIRQICASGKQ